MRDSTAGCAPPHSDDAVDWDERVRLLGTAERERFVLVHAPLVRYVAQRLLARLPASVELQDLIHDGLVGLIEALNRFDPARGVRFRTFAEARVRGAILDALRARDVASRSLRRKLRELDAARVRLEGRMGRPAGDEDVARELGVATSEVARLQNEREAARATPGDPRLLEADSEMGLPSAMPGPFEQLASAELVARLVAAVEDLPERDRSVLGLYYEEGLTLREIGEVLGITESRVCQIHARIVTGLRARLGAHERASVGGSGWRRS